MAEKKAGSEKEKFITSVEKDECDYGDVGCGVGICKPACLRPLATLPVFTGVFSICSLLTSTLIVYVNSQVTTLERQFGFSSSETGLILAANDIGFLVSTLFVGYLAPKVHIPRWLSMAVILFGISGITCSIPHFLFGVDSILTIRNDDVTSVRRMPTGQMCTTNNQTECSVDSSGIDVPPSFGISGTKARTSLWIIVIGMILQGFAKGPKHTFIVCYMDNNTEKAKTGFLLGIVISLSIFGPAVAFTLGGVFTKIYVTLDDVNIGPRHPRWIGAWWLGFVVFGVAAIILALPLFLFPKYLNGRKPRPENKPDVGPGFKNWGDFKENVKRFCHLLIKIMANPIFVMLQITSCLHMFAVAGSRSFLPKYVENQFSLTAWQTNITIASLSLTTASIGTFFGGWLTKRFKFTPVGNLKYVIIVSFILLGLKCLGFVFGCDQPEIVNMPGSPLQNSSCYDNCQCKDEEFFPICSDDQQNFYSPCHAGCPSSDGNTYMNCTCITSGRATAGFCTTDCPYLYPYVILSAIVALIGTTCIIPKYITMIRCVTEEQKPLGTALISFFSSLFGWLLGPLVYGKIIDSICLVWDSRCGERGACTLYDINMFRYKFHGFVIGVDLVSVILMCITVFVSRNHEHMNTKPEVDKHMEGKQNGEKEMKENNQKDRKEYAENNKNGEHISREKSNHGVNDPEGRMHDPENQNGRMFDSENQNNDNKNGTLNGAEEEKGDQLAQDIQGGGMILSEDASRQQVDQAQNSQNQLEK
ncbi:solute carrier organic anion transporter family member 2A1 [Patella vulgata]|uniref:solute carrier organic anion transporter family member 2A1 n=1 Tax=Patella vulgata TaxID=6465 RepID=UPI0024A97B59|nr:solute carrier organic anion transporter family member 2A1 [Patella vulgata]